MRIKVNKNCCEPSAEWEQFRKENADQIEYIRNDAKVRTIGGVCFECGTELYGEWYLRKVSSIKYKEHYVSFYNSQETISPAVKARGEQLVEQLKREDAQAEKERDTFMSSGAVCPVCGHFAKLGGSTVINETPDDALWDYYRVLRDRTNFQSGAKIKDICAQYDITVSPSREMMEKINKADTESLKSYLFHLIQLETHILSLRKNLRNLYTEQFFNQIDVNRINYAPAIRAKEEKRVIVLDMTLHRRNTQDWLRMSKS